MQHRKVLLGLFASVAMVATPGVGSAHPQDGAKPVAGKICKGDCKGKCNGKCDGSCEAKTSAAKPAKGTKDACCATHATKAHAAAPKAKEACCDAHGATAAKGAKTGDCCKGHAVAGAKGACCAPGATHAHDKASMGECCKPGACAWPKGASVDGVYGPLTEQGVRAFQACARITVDGIVGPRTRYALGLKGDLDLRRGDKGEAVRALQMALAHHTHAAKPTPKPVPTPTPKPTPMWTPPPPTPMPTAMPTPMWTPMPTPMPTMSPVSMGPCNEPMLELHAGNWFLPKTAGGSDFDYAMSSRTLMGGGTLWMGNMGLGAEAVSFNPPAQLAKGTTVNPNTLMVDGLLRFRFDRGFYQWFLGYRGLGVADSNFGTLGLAMDRPLFGDWLWLQARAQGGYGKTNGAPANGYFLDGQAGLGLRLGFLTLEGGYRHMRLDSGVPNTVSDLNGPVGTVRIAF